MCSIDDIHKIGSTGLKVIYKCDGENCKFPNKTHSIMRYHLNINRSTNMHEKIQICRSCQTSGSKNPKYGDNRTWDQIMGNEKSTRMKDLYSKIFSGVNNPSKCDEVKKKKNQIIINFESVSILCRNNNFILKSISGDNKFARIYVTCCNNHTFDILYHSFVVRYICRFCYYDSIRISLEDIEKFEKYSKVVRSLTRSIFRKNKYLIDPINFKSEDSKEYHIDHIYSIADGFKNNINPNIISSYVNLRVITSDENLKKGTRSDMELDELMERYLLITN